jgi:hypothetical protein
MIDVIFVSQNLIEYKIKISHKQLVLVTAPVSTGASLF